MNAEVGDSSLALCSLESVISKFRIGFRISNFQPRLSSPGNLRLTAMGIGGYSYDNLGNTAMITSGVQSETRQKAEGRGQK